MRKRSYQDQLRTQIHHWQDRIDELRAQAGASGADPRRRVEEQIEDLRAKQEAANRKLAQLDRRGGGTGRSRVPGPPPCGTKCSVRRDESARGCVSVPRPCRPRFR